MQLVVIFALVVSIFSVMFALQNPTIVPLKFIIWNFEAPLALYLLVAIAIGAILASLLTIPGWFRNRKTSSRHNKEIQELEDSLSKYRSNLIDAQNSNKDLRQKIIEIEEVKEKLEQAQKKANEEINDLNTALRKADLTTQEAQQARQEALDARAQMDLALQELEKKLAESEAAMDHADDLPETIVPPLLESVPESTIENRDLSENALLDGSAEEAAALETEESDTPAAEPANPTNEVEETSEENSENKRKFRLFN